MSAESCGDPARQRPSIQRLRVGVAALTVIDQSRHYHHDCLSSAARLFVEANSWRLIFVHQSSSFHRRQTDHYVGDSSRRPHPSPDSPGAVPLQTSRHRGHDEAPSPSDQRHSDRRSTTHPIVNRPPFTVTPTVSWSSGRQPLPTVRRPSAEDAAKRLLTVTWIVIATVILCSPTTVFDRMMSPSVW